MYLQTSGEFENLDPVERFETKQELLDFLKRESRLGELHLHAHLKRLKGTLGPNPLYRCSCHLITDKGRFHVAEEGFGADTAVKSALLTLKFRIEKHLEMLHDARTKIEGRRALAAEG